MTIFEATQKVSNIIRSRFGCPVEFHYSPTSENLASPKTHLDDFFATIKRNSGAQFIISKGSFLVPVYVDADLFGCIEIKNTESLDASTCEDLHSLVDATLKEFIVQAEALRRLKIKESLLTSASTENLVPLFKKNKNLQEKPFHLVDYSFEKNPVKSALFISGYDYSKMRDLAVDVHGLLNRNSFIPYSVLDFKNSFMEEMAELGKITIFIPEIIDLPAFEIDEIINYLSKNTQSSCPFIIISSQKSLENLQAEELIPLELIEIFKRFHLELNEKFFESQKTTSFWNLNPSPEVH